MSDINDILDYTDFEEINQNNYQKIKNKAIKIGYSDGVNDGHQSVFQEGFDKGYKSGLTAAFNLNKYRFFFENLNTEKITDANLIKEKEEFLINESKKLPMEDSSISSGSEDYVKESLNELAEKMPVATKLLNI